MYICSGSWILELFRNVIYNHQITYLSGLVDFNEFKKWKRNTCKIKGEKVGTGSSLMQIYRNKNQLRRRNPGEENKPWFLEYRLLLLGDLWLKCAHIRLKTRVVCPCEEIYVIRCSTDSMYWEPVVYRQTDGLTTDWCWTGISFVFYNRVVR